MKSIRLRLLVAAMAVLMGTVAARSQTADAPPPPPGHGHEFAMHGPMGFLSPKLNLSDDQKTQIKTMMQKEHPAMKTLMAQQHQIDLQLRQYIEGNYDEAKVQALAQQKAQIQTQLTVAETRIHSQMYQLLTADQQSQLKQMEATRETRMQARMNRQAPPAAPEQ